MGFLRSNNSKEAAERRWNLLAALVALTGVLTTLSGVACQSAVAPTTGRFSGVLSQQVGADIRECPEGKDESGDCSKWSPYWIDATALVPPQVVPTVAALPAEDSEETIARMAVGQVVYGRFDGQTPGALRVFKPCQVPGAQNVPEPVAHEPITPLKTSISVYSQASAKIVAEMKNQVATKLSIEADSGNLLAAFEVELKKSLAEKTTSGNESNVLLVKAALRTDGRSVPLEVRGSSCFAKGNVVVTGVSGFVIVRSTSAAEGNLASIVETALAGAVKATIGDGPAKDAFGAEARASMSYSVVNSVTKSSGFKVDITQKKFYPVWIDTQVVECTDVSSKSKGTTVTLSLSDAQKASGYWRAGGTCSGGDPTYIDDGLQCAAKDGVEQTVTLSICRLSRAGPNF